MAIKPVSVSKINSYIKSIFDTDGILRSISIEGEISNLKLHSSGHIYLSLKDESSSISCFINKSYGYLVKSILENGLKIVAKGSISVFVQQGSYQFYISEVEVEGRGPLEIAFDEIKSKLEKEGLFSPLTKKPIPQFPNRLIKRIAIVTSPTGAAIADMLRTIKDKNNFVDILIVPALVQGNQAAEDIARAIRLINEQFNDSIDLMIVGRGGGSREDLWAFNEEVVARAIFDSNIPVISAVGHEIDFTISDMVADLRAATPTAAAAISVPSTEDILIYLEDLKLKADSALDSIITDKKRQLDLLEARLKSLDPKNSIDRGYGAVLNNDRKLIKSISELNVDDTISILLSDGEIEVTINKIKG